VSHKGVSVKIFTNLKLSRHGVYYYRAIVPISLRNTFGFTEIKRSLHTKNPALARLYAQYLNLSLKIGLQGYETLLSLNKSNLINLKTMANDFPDIDLANIRGWTLRRADGVTLEADPNNPKDLESAEKVASLFFKDIEHTNTNSNSKAENAKISSIKTKWIERLKIEKQKNKTIDEYQSKLDVFIKFVNDIEIVNISPKHVSEFVNQLSNGKITGSALSASTVNKYICALNSFLTQAVRDDLWPEHKPFPTNKQRLKKTKNTRSTSYIPFEQQDLVNIFNVDNIHWKNLGGNDFRPHMLWLPLLSLYTGARIEELCQLSINNIYKDDEQVWIIDINDEDERQLKTEASVRKTPLHPILIKLGFLDYLEDLKRNFPEEKLIFPYLTQNKYGKYGDVPSKWFGRYLEKLGIIHPKKVFHSFRSTANNVLKKAGVEEEVRCQMVGHEYSSTNSANYSDHHTPKWLFESIIPKLEYPNLDLTKLTYVKESHLSIIEKLLRSKRSKIKHKETLVKKY
jgi:integrase